MKPYMQWWQQGREISSIKLKFLNFLNGLSITCGTFQWNGTQNHWTDLFTSQIYSNTQIIITDLFNL